MNDLTEIPLSVLDLAPIREGGTAAEAFRNSRDLARHAQRWGYRRYGVAEHHNIPGIAGAATGADELMITGQIFDHAARLRSFELIAAGRAPAGSP